MKTKCVTGVSGNASKETAGLAAELEERNRLAEAEAERAYAIATSELTVFDDDDPDAPPPIADLIGELELRIDELGMGNLVDEDLGTLRSMNVRQALVTPVSIVWTEQKEGTQADPISGNPKPVTATRRKLSSIAAPLSEARGKFKEYVAGLTAMARKVDSPAYPEFREVYLSVRSVLLTNDGVAAFPEELADDVLARLEELLGELAADIEIVRFKIGGRS